MMDAVSDTLKDSDVILWIADVRDDLSLVHDEIKEMAADIKVPFFLVLNKAESKKNKRRAVYWTELYGDVFAPEDVYIISALDGAGTEALLAGINSKLPEHPPFYNKEQLAITQTRFFVSELIRETIFENFDKEIPYQTTVNIVSYKEKSDITAIEAEIVCYRDTQKGILVGKNGSNIKKTSMVSREKIEDFLQEKVYLNLRVKVRPKWRDTENYLREYGY